jgi:hypothetical protein
LSSISEGQIENDNCSSAWKKNFNRLLFCWKLLYSKVGHEIRMVAFSNVSA